MPKVATSEIQVPTFIYGTAWKEGETQALTKLAIESGFLAIDTANQRRHYYEEGVGKGLQETYKQGTVTREQLFLQTKFTYANGQDHRKPYDDSASFSAQVEQSFASSLEHLQTTYIDSYILHGPSSNHGINDIDWQVWQAMEKLYETGKIKSLGVSNVTCEQLKILYDGVKIKPVFVQNRCFANMLWDQETRNFCYENSIKYQGFSLLTANQQYLQTSVIQKISHDLNKTIPQIIFKFAIDVGMIPLTGTTNIEHMKIDLDIYNFDLNSNQVRAIENIAVS